VHVVILQGFQSWDRDTSLVGWGFTLAPWMVIALFILLVVLSSFLVGETPFRRTMIDQAAILDGVAPPLGPAKIIHSDIVRSWNNLLDSL
jgi:hypothetical protein